MNEIVRLDSQGFQLEKGLPLSQRTAFSLYDEACAEVDKPVPGVKGLSSKELDYMADEIVKDRKRRGGWDRKWDA